VPKKADATTKRSRKAASVRKPTDDESVYYARKEGVLPKLRRPCRVIDLFAGAGGMSVGFSRRLGHHFTPVWANDFNGHAVRTYNENLGPHCIHGDITELLEAEPVPAADVVIGGPPCQGFSLLNKKRRGDRRKQLWRPFLEVVGASHAFVFVMENVPQLLGSEERAEILEAADAIGFKTASAKLCAADYGVPQTRDRAFIVGCNFTDPNAFFPPKRTHWNPRLRDGTIQERFTFDSAYIPEPAPWRTVRDAIADLEPPVGTEIREDEPPYDLQFGRSPTKLSRERYRAIPEEGMSRFDLQERALHLTPDCWIRKTSGGTDLFGRLWWDRPAFTIRTEFFKPEKGRYLHPEQHRPITHREAARFQSFPDRFRFTGTKIEIARQIGNAVPPELAARVGRSPDACGAQPEHGARARQGHQAREARPQHGPPDGLSVPAPSQGSPRQPRPRPAAPREGDLRPRLLLASAQGLPPLRAAVDQQAFLDGEAREKRRT